MAKRERTLKLWDAFVATIAGASFDQMILVEPYAVPGREDAMEPCGERLANEIHTQAPEKRLTFAASLDEAAGIARGLLAESDVVLVIGAGDIHTISRKLLI